MRLYAGTSTQFVQDTAQNQIAEKLRLTFFEHFQYNPSPAKISSWRNSLRAVSDVFREANLDDHGVILEYQLPLSSRRLDCMICGKDEKREDAAVILELKQWEKCKQSMGENAIKEKLTKSFSARMKGAYCWHWSKDLDHYGRLKNDVLIGDYSRPWNARHDATRLPPDVPKAHYWAYDPNGINHIGCVYTAQGFEFDYVGVIFGNDLTYNLDEQRWEGHPENSQDPVIKRSKDGFTRLTQNTYRVLLSRGMKGCYVYFIDKDTKRFVKSRIQH